MEETIEDEISNHISNINKEMEKLTQVLKLMKANRDFNYSFNLEYDTIFKFWKVTLELEHTEKINF